MKTKFEIKIHTYDYENDRIIKMIDNHNNSLVNIDIDVIDGYVRARNALYPLLAKYITKMEGDTLHIFNTKEIPTISIRTIFE